MSEPLVLINLFAMEPDAVDAFVENWPKNLQHWPDDGEGGQPKGFRGTRLHRAVDPDAQYPVVNIARWDSVEDWQNATRAFFTAASTAAAGGQALSGAATPHPGLYTVVHEVADPTTAS